MFEISSTSTAGLSRTASQYNHGSALETRPTAGEFYIICKDGSVQSVSDPNRPIGWELIENDDRFYWRVTQVGFSPERATVFSVEYTDDYPDGKGFIGSIVSVCTSRDAMIVDFDDGDDEVTSPFSLPCPGAQLKAPRTEIPEGWRTM
jgi:hypothetical protein